jgi:hypothetical protein
MRARPAGKAPFFGLARSRVQANIPDREGWNRRSVMTGLRCLTVVAAAFAMSLSAGAACDDYAEEMALAEAMKAAQSAQSAAAQAAPATQAPAPAATESTSVASADKAAAETPPAVARQ